MSTDVVTPDVVITPRAAGRVHALISEEGNPKLKLRVYITGGGCSGFQYGFAFDETMREDDRLFEHAAQMGEQAFTVGVLVDALSMMYLEGAQIDYVETLQGAHFTIKNPNAQTTCSCGSSFSV